MNRVNVANSPSPHSRRTQLLRVLWHFVWLLLYRPSPKIFHGWRRFLLRLFGAQIGKGAHPHPSVKIWAPWNLQMADHSCLAPHVDCYCVAPIKIGAHTTISQYSYLCTASHDIEHPEMPLITAPITIGDGAWITADVFIAPGVTVGDGAVVGARSSVFSNVAPWTVVAGNPARFLKQRILKEATIESGRGLPRSKALPRPSEQTVSRSVLECGSPLPLSSWCPDSGTLRMRADDESEAA